MYCSVFEFSAVNCSVLRKIRSWRWCHNDRVWLCEIVYKCSSCVVTTTFTTVALKSKTQFENMLAILILEHLYSFARFQMCVCAHCSHRHVRLLCVCVRVCTSVCARASCYLSCLVVVVCLRVYVSFCHSDPIKVVVVWNWNSKDFQSREKSSLLCTKRLFLGWLVC